MNRWSFNLDRMLNGLGPGGQLGLVMGFIVFVGFLASLSRVVKNLAPEHQRLTPNQIWLNLIPFFNLFWLTVTVERIGESIRSEMTARGQHSRFDGYGKTTGLITTVLLIIGVVAAMPIAWVIALISGIAYWSQINGYSRKLRDEVSDLPPEDAGW